MPAHVPPFDWAESGIQLAERLVRRREALGLTQEQVAARTGLSRNQVQNIEKSRSWPRVDTLWSMAAGLEISAAELVDGLGGPEQR